MRGWETGDWGYWGSDAGENVQSGKLWTLMAGEIIIKKNIATSLLVLTTSDINLQNSRFKNWTKKIFSWKIFLDIMAHGCFAYSSSIFQHQHAFLSDPGMQCWGEERETVCVPLAKHNFLLSYENTLSWPWEQIFVGFLHQNFRLFCGWDEEWLKVSCINSVLSSIDLFLAVFDRCFIFLFICLFSIFDK